MTNSIKKDETESNTEAASRVDVFVSRAGYIKGKHIESFTEFAERLEKGLPFYWRHKFMAAGFIEHWSIVMIKNSIKCRVLICADKYDG